LNQDARRATEAYLPILQCVSAGRQRELEGPRRGLEEHRRASDIRP
jgi:hypothetical protein